MGLDDNVFYFLLEDNIIYQGGVKGVGGRDLHC